MDLQLGKLLSRDAPQAVQFLKYAFVGAFATAINIVVAEALAAWVIPCLGADDILVSKFGFPVAGIPDGARAARAVACNIVGFVAANLACWVLNRAFVFRPGRHHWAVELALFFGGSALAVGIGSGIIYLTILIYGVQTSWAFLVNVVVSVMVNYVVRKFYVFKG